MAQRARRYHAIPFTTANSTGYTQAEMDALNSEFDRRWHGGDAEEPQTFRYADGEFMTAEDAIKQFQDEVARR